MWIKFPEGCTNFTHAQQDFKVEVTEYGVGYGRVPNHFVPFLQSLGMGFTPAEPEDTNGLGDLPPEDAQRDAVIAGAASEIAALQEKLRDANSEVQRLEAHLAGKENELTLTQTEANNYRDELAKLKAALDDKGVDIEALLDPKPPVGKK